MYSKQKPYNKIGFVDSGLGGLTVFKKVKKLMPNKEYIYFADSANVPYGSKTREQMIKISENIVRFFNEQQIDLLVVACNTLTSIALSHMRSIANFDIIGVVEYGVKSALQATYNKKVGVIATKATVDNGLYKKLLEQNDIEVCQSACLDFVGFVEEDCKDKKKILKKVEEYLKPVVEFGADTIILGCTHYPILIEYLKEYTGENITFVDPADSLSEDIFEICGNYQNKCDIKYYVTKNPSDFKINGSKIIGEPIKNVTEME